MLSADIQNASSVSFLFRTRPWEVTGWSCNVGGVLWPHSYFVLNNTHIWLSWETFLFGTFQKANKTQCLKRFFCFADGHFLRWFFWCVFLIELKNKLFNIFLGALAWKSIFFSTSSLLGALSPQHWAWEISLERTFFLPQKEKIKSFIFILRVESAKNGAGENFSFLF